MKYELNLQYRKILGNTALSLAQQSLIYDNRPDRKWISKNISKHFWFQTLVLPGFFQNMGKQ